MNSDIECLTCAGRNKSGTPCKRRPHHEERGSHWCLAHLPSEKLRRQMDEEYKNVFGPLANEERKAKYALKLALLSALPVGNPFWIDRIGHLISKSAPSAWIKVLPVLEEYNFRVAQMVEMQNKFNKEYETRKAEL